MHLRKKCFFCGKEIVLDPDLLEKLTTEEEMSGLLYLAIRAAQRLIRRRRFIKSPSIEQVAEEYEKKANSVKAWASARCISHDEYETEKEVLEKDFEGFCNRKKLPVVNRVHLGREINTLYGVRDAKRGSKNNQSHVWKGIGLRRQLKQKGINNFLSYDESGNYVDEIE